MDVKNINGVRIHYRFSPAEGDAPTVVFSNSLGTDFRIWDGIVAALPPGVGALCYDKRGHGLSDLGETPYVIDDHVDDLLGLVDALRLRRFVICGLSVGGLIAQGAYARAPERVTGLILTDTGHKIGNAEMWNERIAAVETDGIAAIADAILTRWFAPSFHSERPLELAGYRNMLCRTPAAGYAGTGVAIRDADYTDAAGRIAVPTLCLVGEFDGSTPPELVETLAGLIPGADFAVIANAGHLPNVEQPAVFSKHLNDFLNNKVPNA